MREIRFTDTTFRDGNASLWAMGMRTGMMLAVAADMDKAGFVAIDVIGAAHFKKCVRELREDPWQRIRLLAKSLPNTPMAVMSNPNSPLPFGTAPLSLVKLFLDRLAANGIRRLQILEPSNDMTNRLIPAVAFAHETGLEVVVALVFSLSPKHTDEYYAEKAREAVALGADVVYLKDSGGLLTPERVRSIIPAIRQNLNGTPLEFHTHCTTGLGPLSLLAAVETGVDTVHTAVPPLADGSSQPSIFNATRNLRALGFMPSIDEDILTQVSDCLYVIARREGLPIGRPVEYEYSQYVHQVPGGAISNLRHQLAQMGMEDRLSEVLEESIRVRQDLGYPIMVTPFAQLVVSQATINIFVGERYQTATDEIIKYTLGFYGSEASLGVAQDVRDRILDRPRANELAAWEPPEPSLAEVRASLGGVGVTDDELLLRYAVGDEVDLAQLRSWGQPEKYKTSDTPLLNLIEGLIKRREIRHITINKPGFSLVLEDGQISAPPYQAARVNQIASEGGADVVTVERDHDMTEDSNA